MACRLERHKAGGHRPASLAQLGQHGCRDADAPTGVILLRRVSGRYNWQNGIVPVGHRRNTIQRPQLTRAWYDVAWVFGHRTFHSLLVEREMALNDDLRRCRNVQVDGFAANDIDRLTHVTTDHWPLRDAVTQRHASEERHHWILAERERERHGLAKRLPHG